MTSGSSPCHKGTRHRFSALAKRVCRRMIGAFCALGLCLGLISADLHAGSAVITDKQIQARLALMRQQKEALLSLSEMMAGRRVFTPQTAKAARRVLMNNTRKIPKRFAKQRMDPNSYARPEIWVQWQDFEARAEVARQAAKQISANSVNGLRRSLPTMIRACHSCHQTYRTTPNQAITH